MSKLTIVDVKPKPWWKFWTVDNLEVTIKDEQGNIKKMTIYEKGPTLLSLLKQGIIEKYYTGDQFWSLHQAQRRSLEKVRLLVGERFDAGVLKNEWKRRHMEETLKDIEEDEG